MFDVGVLNAARRSREADMELVQSKLGDKDVFGTAKIGAAVVAHFVRGR